ncbi:MAG TPA: zf-HC2 domain-containing protein [Clostridiaceae bacterium]|nr:zf-HC2 domain-containing protein [Clostridiaceae bacterium]
MRHYSISRWKDYANGNITGLEKVLMEEHLAHCSQCLESYLEVLEGSGILRPAPENITDRIMAAVSMAESHQNNCKKDCNRVKKGKIRDISRFAVAASIALILWQFGVFGQLSMSMLKVDEMILSRRETDRALVNGFGDKMINQLNSFFDTITEKGDVMFNEKKK